jgi:hypothetical protein
MSAAASQASLRLRTLMGPVEMIVIESAERPAEN